MRAILTAFRSYHAYDLYDSYTRLMSAAPELPISDAREHLADVVNEATYAGTVTFLTRRGRRIAAIVPLEQAMASETRAREAAVAATCRAVWLSVQDADAATKNLVREAIDRLMDQAEDASDIAAVDAARAEMESGSPSVAWTQLRDELGL